MTPPDPAPLCACGHARSVHNNGKGWCVSPVPPMCRCLSYAPAAPPTREWNVANERDLWVNVCHDLLARYGSDTHEFQAIQHVLNTAARRQKERGE